jgi:hypothetical protein
MLVDCNRQLLLRFILTDDVVIQKFFDLDRFRQWRPPLRRFLLLVVCNDLVADVYAFIADINGRARYQLLYFVLRFSAKRAAQSVIASSHQISLPDSHRLEPGGSCPYQL